MREGETYKISTNEKMLHDISSIIELVDSIILCGFHRNASDIHIDPTANGVVVRLRIDGILTFTDVISKESKDELIARIKILSGLRTDIHFVPQDGRFRFVRDTYDYDIRVSIIPTHYGENAVLRLLKNNDGIPNLHQLGFSDHDIDRVLGGLSKNEGMVLVVGPTGSGKTSTLYTIISSLSDDKKSIITLEDPIEYSIEGVRQIQINQKHGIGFANGLRSIVRQDPDIIMVGEIRDTETAQIATNISLTGHLLLSTLHTNGALGAIPRLLDMNIDSYLVASTLSLIIAQRLVRKLCVACKGAGCGVCGSIGYKGRTVLTETVIVDEELRRYIMSKVESSEISRYLKSKGMKTIYEDGMEKVEKGITSLEEVKRVLYAK